MTFDASGFPSEILREVWLGSDSVFPSLCMHYLVAWVSSLDHLTVSFCVQVLWLLDGANFELQTHVHRFRLYFLFCRRCDICSGEELMSYAVPPSLGGMHTNGAPNGGPIWEGLFESLVRGQAAAGDGSVCHSIRIEEAPFSSPACISKRPSTIHVAGIRFFCC